jgi:thioredoxin reductase (NADPH)
VQRIRLRERAFKRLAFATTIAGLALMAIGLQQGVLLGRWLVTLVLVVAGGALALVSVVVEPTPEAGFTITLYSREACSLCDEARAFLVGKKAEYDYDLWEVDVDKDAAAGAKYSDWVPVATVGGEELFRLQADYPRLEARLRALADARLRR